ncbi:GNAT family N-acetyltransferase [Planococcus glaciei]|uniref:GNAT family N-acetyltransferase n=1 Tax=Planococcus glaciei TaxID=459472 RepID=A0A7H8QBS8_9BACL|nr:GNAT family N-acetyltransferase [Planococcus glaciei]QDY45746.1 GNAT family N-acetyltransferase [Planococcus glaciei]QKX50971.1 GNAT family N-acetyltransferase [Planococcus glaciei]
METAVEFRNAVREDLDRIVEMLADDMLGKERERFEQPLPNFYIQAFEAIEADPNNELIVACLDGEIVGVQQITFTPYIARQGSWRATIEGVRTAASVRGKGIGRQMISWAIERAKERGCRMVQLTSDKQREDALRFYGQLGFEATHEGLKLQLE